MVKNLAFIRSQAKQINAGENPIFTVGLPIRATALPNVTDGIGSRYEASDFEVLRKDVWLFVELSEIDALRILENHFEMQEILKRHNKRSISATMELPCYIQTFEASPDDSRGSGALRRPLFFAPDSEPVDRARFESMEVVFAVEEDEGGFDVSVDLEAGDWRRGIHCMEVFDFSCDLEETFFYHVYRHFPRLMQHYDGKMPVEHAAVIHSLGFKEAYPAFKSMDADKDSIWVHGSGNTVKIIEEDGFLFVEMDAISSHPDKPDEIVRDRFFSVLRDYTEATDAV